jgi:hypothetical protein
MDLNRTCESCGERFYQYRGRPAKRCPDCRGGDRYGAAHQAMRSTAEQAYGQRCTRCRKLLEVGQPLEPDHLDGGGPSDYAGWAHASCNHRAGAARGNRLRAQAYRALRDGVVVGQAVNGSGAVMVRKPPPEPPKCQRSREEIMAEAKTTGQGLPCLCGRITSRCW